MSSTSRLSHFSPRPRIAVTGIGIVTPFGMGREISWRGICSGQSALDWLPASPQPDSEFTDRKPSRAELAGGAVRGRKGEASSGGDEHSAGKLDPVVKLAELAAEEAWQDAELATSQAEATRIGCVIGTSKGGLRSFATAFAAERSAENWPARFWEQFLPHQSATHVAARLGLGGPTLVPVAACATGLLAVHRAADLIREGAADIVLAGSCDASLQPAVLGSFHRMGVLARCDSHPSQACRPFARDRSGFLVGEGAAVLVLERWESAVARGIPIYAEWLAGGVAGDPTGLTHLATDGISLARLMTDVLERAGRGPADLDYINLHGTATMTNDLCETQAIHRALGRCADRVPCSSLKGSIGHLLGAAGSVELAAAILAIRDGRIPPTVNLETPDPQCDLDYVPGHFRESAVQTALKLSLGFGGHLVAGVVCQAESVNRRAPAGV